MSAHTSISSPMDDREREPQRLSALYQYHNAPEVAPAHGLEFDDNVYPHSDKYPVVREAPSYDTSNYKGKHAFINDNRPPRIIFGMKVRTFLVVASIMALIIVGAAVGGAVGGKSMRQNQMLDGTFTPNLTANASASARPSSTISAFSAPTPTYAPLTYCSNDTSYTSTYANGSSGTVPEGVGMNFTVYCNLTNPLSQSSASKIAEAYTYSLSDCIEVCAGYNFWNSGSNCTVAAYQPSSGRPGNCWIGSAPGVKVSSLGESDGIDVALLHQS